jgi:hypothetical protein
LEPSFDDFLFAPIGEDRNDMPLSVLSALARLDIDPWQEADKLAQLPGQTAARRLASLIAALPDWPSMHLDHGTIAAPLIALLPRRTHSNIPSREALRGGDVMTNFRTAILMAVIYVITATSMMGAQWIAASSKQPAQVDSAHAPASSTVFSQRPPPNSRQ